MAVYKSSNSNYEASSTERKIGISLLLICTVAFVALFTNLITFLKVFLLGVMGLFSYPLFLTLFIVSLALINNRKYVMSKKYILYLSLTITCILSILHLVTINSDGLNFFDYIAKSYTQQMSAGGIICGIITAPFVFILNKTASYIIFAILTVVFGALMVDFLYYAKDQTNLNKPVKVVNSPLIKDIPDINLKKESFNVFLGGQSNNTESTLEEKLANITNSRNNDIIISEEPPKPQSRREYLLTPPKFDLNEYLGYSKKEVQKNVDILKHESNGIRNPEINKTINMQTNTFSSSPLITKEETNNENSSLLSKSNPHNEENKILESQDKEEKLADKILRDILKEEPKISISTSQTNQSDNKPMLKPEKEKFKQVKLDTDTTEEAKPKSYARPPISLLTTNSMDLSMFSDDIILKRCQLENALETFGIPAKVIGVVIGPAVTRYELEMPPGISVKKVLSHQEDIALVLASTGNIRIEAPIPGKSAVGIEVPNKSIATVGLRDIISSNDFQNHKSSLALSLGKDINGNVVICNLQKMPHLLVAGSTGSGKSVCLNSIILSIIFKATPEEVRLLLIDPKCVEFSMFNGLPHLLTPNVITEPDKAVNALNYAIEEMERRFKLFQASRTKNLEEYNLSSDVVNGFNEKLPFIVIIVDELADLMMTTKKEVEDKIMRLAQKSRAAGIHLILATQRPSVDVITGTIKINFPSRVAFAVSNFADSKTVLDQGGAEKLLGKGDMLYAPNDAPEPKRVQGCFVTTKEIDDIVDYVKQNSTGYEFDKDVDEFINPKKVENNLVADVAAKPQNDPLLPEVLKYFIENGQASITMIQRRFVVGFPRASRIIDQMERAKYISPPEGSKPRTVYLTMEQYEEIFGKENND